MANTSTPVPAPMTQLVLGADAYAARQAARRARAIYVSRSEVARQYRELSDRWNAQR